MEVLGCSRPCVWATLLDCLGNRWVKQIQGVSKVHGYEMTKGQNNGEGEFESTTLSCMIRASIPYMSDSQKSHRHQHQTRASVCIDQCVLAQRRHIEVMKRFRQGCTTKPEDRFS